MQKNNEVNIDYEAFDNNGIDSISDNSWIIKQFNAKNRRVNAIFRDDNDDDEVFGVSITG
jgi:hypothetical protein